MNAGRKGRRSIYRAMPRLSAAGLGMSAVSAAATAQPIRFADPVRYTDTGRAGYLVSADLDRDANVDVVVTGGGAINIYFNDGTGQLHPETTIPYRSIWNLAAADMDADQHVDLVWFDQREDRTYVLSVWYNAGDGHSGEVVETAFPGFENVPAVIWDLTSDGLEDVVFSAEPTSVDAFINQGNRTFALKRLFEYDLPDYELYAFVPGDFDDDGDADIAATFQYIHIYNYQDKTVIDTNVSLLLNDRQIPFRLGPEISLPWSENDVIARSMVAGDLDGDSDLDAIVAGSPGNDPGPDEFALLENTGGRLSLADTYRASAGWPREIALADIDTDGRLDLVYVTGDIQGAYVVRNEGDFNFLGMSPFPTGMLGSSMSVADLDGNGQFDLMHSGSSGFAVLMNQTSLRGPRLAVSTLVRGHVGTFLVENAEPGETVHFLYSTHGVGRTRGRQELGGITRDLRSPMVPFATARVGPDGTAVLQRRIPDNATLGPVTFQAVIRRGPLGRDSVKSTFKTVLIED